MPCAVQWMATANYSSIMNCVFTAGIYQQAIYVEPDAQGVAAMGNNAVGSGITPFSISGAAQRKSTIWGNNWVDPAAGQHLVTNNDSRNLVFADYSDTTAGTNIVGRKARGSPTSPAVVTSADPAITLSAQFWDGVDTFRTGGAYRVQALGAQSPTATGAQHIWSAANVGTTVLSDVLAMNYNTITPLIDQTMNIGTTLNRLFSIWSNCLTLVDGVSVPSTQAGHARIYIDTADGDLKIKFADGVIKTIVVDT